MIRIKRGLNLPLVGEPEQSVFPSPAITRVGVTLADYRGLHPHMLVENGECVRTGQPLFCDANAKAICVTSPATGTVRIEADADGVHTLSIAVEADAYVEFPAVAESELPLLTDAQVRQQLLSAGLWPAFRTRPLQGVPGAEVKPHAIFVTAMDTQPLAPRAERLIEADLPAFSQGLTVISHLTSGLVYVCKAPAAYVPVPDIVNIKVEEFAGAHPAGLAGTHIHFLDRIGNGDKQVWSINYQDVMAIGRLFVAGRVDAERIVALAGSQVIDARLLRVRLGADLRELTAGQLKDQACCVISGSVLHGRGVRAERPYLGRYHQQVSVLPTLPTAPQRWWGLGVRQFSALPVFLARLLRIKKYRLYTEDKCAEDKCAEGNQPPQPLLITAAYERVWPLRFPVLPLLDALVAQDAERAVKLGALELAEEDLALCSFVCPGKQDYGALLRAVLEKVQASQSSLPCSSTVANPSAPTKGNE